MRRINWLLALASMFVPCTSHAVQLLWSNNRDTLTFASATRCTLTIAADSQEQRLPSEWVLLWVGDGLSIQPLVLGSEAACSGQVAQASALDPPSNAADSLDHRTTAHLCSADNVVGASTMYLFDLPGGARARFKVIALDPADPDSERVIESSEATCNGGVPDPYPAAVLHASSSHHYGDLSVTLIGSGLAATQSVAIAARDESWRYPLDIVSKSDAAVTAITAIAAPLPPFSAEAMIAGAPPIAVQLPADSFEDPQSPQSCISQFFGSQDSLNLQPKDFAIVYGANKWHLFYIRHHQNAAYTSAVNERNLGHAESGRTGTS